MKALFEAKAGFYPLWGHTGRTCPVSGLPHLLMLPKANMAKVRLAFLIKPR